MSGSDPAPFRVCVSSLDRSRPVGTDGAAALTVATVGSAGVPSVTQTLGGTGSVMSLAAHPSGRVLYGVAETADGGVLQAFRADDRTGHLTPGGRCATGGSKPLYVSVSPAGDQAYVANLGSGSVAVIALDDDGQPGTVTDLREHKGHSVHPQRQSGPHPHSVVPDPAGRWALVADLGTDEVVTYAADAGGLREASRVAVRPGVGPRHLVFHPTEPLVLLVSELGSTLTSFDWDPAAGRLAERQSLSTLPAGFAGTSTAADVRVSPDGRHVYCTNRGHDSIARFTLGADGALGADGHTAMPGAAPQILALSPDGRRLVAGLRDSDAVVICDRDAVTGDLRPLPDLLPARTPACVRVLPA